ncbi:hypothetical protein EYF80_047595 [Liparis tanakae]|uniref:Uncharacterized protein n=1 Tax=Liparis tanakae TaxID=230148 RepID=A0A4Z2FMY1_9TELE|nr:hypothetical protein EYF80_047595 [Liparis tanakae]
MWALPRTGPLSTVLTLINGVHSDVRDSRDSASGARRRQPVRERRAAAGRKWRVVQLHTFPVEQRRDQLHSPEEDESWLCSSRREGEIGEEELREWTHVLPSHRGVISRAAGGRVKRPGATLYGLAAERCFSPPVAAKRTRAHPTWSTGRQEELTSTAASSSGPQPHTAAAPCTF